jgi:hypothetical protein
MKIPKLKSQIPITDIALLSRLEFGILILEFFKSLKQKNHH